MCIFVNISISGLAVPWKEEPNKKSFQLHSISHNNKRLKFESKVWEHLPRGGKHEEVWEHLPRGGKHEEHATLKNVNYL